MNHRTEITFALCLGVVLSAAMGGLLPLAVCAAASLVWPVEEA